MSMLGWLQRIAIMLWLETTADRWRFFARTVVFGAICLIFTGLFVVSIATISESNTALSQIHQTQTERQLQNLKGTHVRLPSVEPKYSLPPQTTAAILKLIGGQSEVAADAPPTPQSIEERAQLAAHRANEKLDKLRTTQRIVVYTNNRQAWPNNTLAQIEHMFGAVKEVNEQEYLDRVQNGRNVWIGVRNDQGHFEWWVWKKETLFGYQWPSRQIEVVTSYIGAMGRIHQQQYLDGVKQSVEYTALPSWPAPSVLKMFSSIDVRALSLFLVVAVFVFPTLLAASQAITWDFNRNKNVYEPYATMKIPVWGVLLKESLSGFWYMVAWATLTAFVCGLLVNRDLDYLVFLMGMIALGLGGCWLNLQINMFLVVTFQTPVGRQLARLLVMPFFFLPYHIFRVFGASEILNILGGKPLEDFHAGWVWSAAVVCAGLGVVVLWLGAWRVGRYRKGFAPS